MTSIGFQQLFLKKLGNVINPAEKKQDAEVEVQPVYERNKLNIRVRNVVKPKASAVTVEGSSKNQSKLLSQQESGRNQQITNIISQLDGKDKSMSINNENRTRQPMNDSFVNKGSVFDNMALSPANKGSLENSLLHTANVALQELANKNKLNDNKINGLKAPSNNNLTQNVSTPQKNDKPAI